MPTAVPVQLIGPDGERVATSARAMPSDADLVRAYTALVAARRLNDQAYALVRQGRLAVYPSSHGQEACQVAAAQVLDAADWLFPTYRDTAAVVARGVPAGEVLVLLKGDWHSGYDPYTHNVAPQATPLATQLLHAVGVAHAARLRVEPTVVLAMCGDGATSEGDFHEALNFAAVFRAPVVFFVQNNEYAISVPLARQSVAPSLAHKGIGYGIRGERVDGNDAAALLTVLGDAVTRAREGAGPQLIEAHTYRMQAHTNADDARRYRADADVAAWEHRDPLARLSTYLRGRGLLDDAGQQVADAAAEELAAGMREELFRDVTPDPADLFTHVFAVPTPQLIEQSAVVADEQSREGALR
ncbi:thiamine pyrophosphate-dependent enzyme [Klenkia taihuensis]|uniref:2-oxoisovalerate dehydrogenase subunit alpha n=1 Tax=Klenkia taihuensis TaxID=1225127 RepID=A0A1I1U436_9ACTN|nr:thiamine pyrophosphate-dependent enzyme [Klenkia taihuensis]GHE06944.1 pyruvate dehydrogenase E1 component subunit alpha [Klenkia taihuensis]SFD65572.1 pyruvate dehydrogenase E1 component alpha subunit [Klenkia taihuensis]